jgi:hypothetical protein
MAVAATLVPLAVVGCRSEQRTVQVTPTERVAGERQEDDTPRLVREAGLPPSFAFGGRMWSAHQIHWEDATDVGAAATSAGRMDNYLPVADLQVDGRQIYRQKGLDEALTDNIFLRADSMAAGAGDDSVATDAGARRIAFVEYDASGSTMPEMDLAEALAASGMPQNLMHGGKKWVADKVQVYDADVFDEVAAMPEMVGGNKAYREEDDDDTLFVMTEVPMSASGAAATPGDATNQPGVSAGENAATPSKGSVFIRYELSR